jgi:hypothetical protein
MTNLGHEDLSKRLEVLPELLLRGLPGQAEYNQIGAFVLLGSPAPSGSTRILRLLKPPLLRALN